jgi:hypothetical protein
VLIYYFLIPAMPLSEHQSRSRDLGATTTPFKVLGGICVIYAGIALAFRGRHPQFLQTW